MKCPACKFDEDRAQSDYKLALEVIKAPQMVAELKKASEARFIPIQISGDLRFYACPFCGCVQFKLS
jgi:hypothetical protein